MISVANRWQSEIRKPANGTVPTAGPFGTTVTADATPHTKGSWVDVIGTADWSGFTGDAFEISINFNNGFTAATVVNTLADIGVDSGGGYSSIIDNLSACNAGQWTTTGWGVNYRFKLKITNGVKIGCRIQSTVGSQTVAVSINVFGNPTHPGLVRAGTFVRTFGADTANSRGTTITPGTSSEGAWTEMTAATSDDLWQWEVGWGCGDSAFSATGYLVDVGKGAAASEVVIAEGFVFAKATSEMVGKLPGTYNIYDVPSGTRIVAREQTGGAETTETLLIYAVGGSYAADSPYVNGIGTAVSWPSNPTWPTHEAGDIGILFMVSQGGATHALDTANGFTQFPDSPQTIGNGVNNVSVSAWWCRATSSSQAAPDVADPGLDSFSNPQPLRSFIVTVRGAIASGNPYDVTAGDTAASTTSVSVPGDTTTVANTLILALVGSGDETATASGWADADLTNISERLDANFSDNAYYLVEGFKAAAGAFAAITATLSAAAAQARFVVALKPAVAAAGSSGYSRGRVVN